MAPLFEVSYPIYRNMARKKVWTPEIILLGMAMNEKKSDLIFKVEKYIDLKVLCLLNES